jgi:hypothetical protein
VAFLVVVLKPLFKAHQILCLSPVVHSISKYTSLQFVIAKYQLPWAVWTFWVGLRLARNPFWLLLN